VWVKVLGNAAALQPYDNVAIFSMPIAFIGIWLFSLLDNSARAAEDKAGFEAQYIRCQTGIGAAGAASH
jgi:cation/acetate symporter